MHLDKVGTLLHMGLIRMAYIGTGTGFTVKYLCVGKGKHETAMICCSGLEEDSGALLSKPRNLDCRELCTKCIDTLHL